MKIRKKKTFRKILQFYRLGFDIVPPYRVLLDGTFIHRAQTMKMDLREQLSKVLLAHATPVVSNCIMQELRSFKTELIEAVVMAKQFYRHKCFHEEPVQHIDEEPAQHVDKDPDDNTYVNNEQLGDKLPHTSEFIKITDGAAQQHVSASDCIRSLIGDSNTSHYFVATEDKELQKFLRRIPGTPLIYFLGQGLILESPSHLSRQKHMELENTKMDVASWERKHLPSLACHNQNDTTEEKKKRKTRGANPLSCLPKKNAHPIATAIQSKPCRTKRRRHETKDIKQHDEKRQQKCVEKKE